MLVLPLLFSCGLGLFCFLSIIVLCLIACGRVAKRCRHDPELLWAQDMARLLRVCIIVYAVSGAALSFAYFEGFWILVALISRLNRTTLELTRPRTRAELALEAAEKQRELERELEAELV